jgi:hypothetical protein
MQAQYVAPFQASNPVRATCNSTTQNSVTAYHISSTGAVLLEELQYLCNPAAVYHDHVSSWAPLQSHPEHLLPHQDIVHAACTAVPRQQLAFIISTYPPRITSCQVAYAVLNTHACALQACCTISSATQIHRISQDATSTCCTISSKQHSHSYMQTVVQVMTSAALVSSIATGNEMTVLQSSCSIP